MVPSTSPVCLTVVATLLLLAFQTSAQSIDPLNGSTFSTPVFSVSPTFTPVTTFARATGGNPTTVGGPGPSPATSSYVFSYTAPTATVPALNPTQVYASLASAGQYNTASDAKGLAPNPNNLQIADSALSSLNVAALKAVFLTVAAAAIVVVVL